MQPLGAMMIPTAKLISLEVLVTGLAVICVLIEPIFSAKVYTINLQTQNSPDLLPKFQSLQIKNGTEAARKTAPFARLRTTHLRVDF